MNRERVGLFIVGMLAFLVLVLPPQMYVMAQGQPKPKAPVKATEPKPKTPKTYTLKDYVEPLDKYLANTPMAGDGQAFYEAEQTFGVRKELLMAIAYAESNYNRVHQRGAKHNPFSLCSYDSTNTTCDFASDRDAIFEAARTLVDARKPIGRAGYTNVGQLSRASNPHGVIWASSMHNWQKNVVNELTKITGQPVTPAWNWRTK